MPPKCIGRGDYYYLSELETREIKESDRKVGKYGAIGLLILMILVFTIWYVFFPYQSDTPAAQKCHDQGHSWEYCAGIVLDSK